MSRLLTPWRFTVYDYHQMAEAGILSEDDRVELIKGEVLRMSPIGSRHAGCLGYLQREFTLQAGDRAIVFVQSPLRLTPHTEPEPDLMLLRPRSDFYRRALPRPEDVFLIIEVADSSLRYDRTVKTPLYAAAEIPEAWIANLKDERFETFAVPGPRGYREREQLPRGMVLSPRLLPEVRISVHEALGEPEPGE